MLDVHCPHCDGANTTAGASWAKSRAAISPATFTRVNVYHAGFGHHEGAARSPAGFAMRRGTADLACYMSSYVGGVKT